MLRFCCSIQLFLLLSGSISAQVNIHVLNPWRNDTCAWHRDSLRMSGNNYVGYYPGSGMTPEGGGWFFYAYSDRNILFNIVNWCGPDVWQDRVSYRYQLSLDTILTRFPAGTKNIWIVISDTTRPPSITDRPPAGSGFKVIYFLSPWEIGGVLIQYQGLAAMPRMIMDTSITRCGWFRYYCPMDTVKVKFVNSLDSAVFSSLGLGNGDFIDLAPILTVSDTVWVYPAPYPNGTPAVSRQFPNVTAPCNKTLLLAAIVRDIDTAHPDFGGFWEQGKNRGKTGCWVQNNWYPEIPGIVQKTLDANGKPILSPRSPCDVDSFSWFTTKYIYDTYPNARCYNLKLTKNEDGLYLFDTNRFFIADDFRFLDSNNTVPNPWWGGGADADSVPHNYNYTMELSAQFEYKKGQTFYFRGDDDVWVFIDGRLVVDDGGIHNPVEKAISLDTLGLTPGKTYDFKLFFCERDCCGSDFKMLTSLNLRTTSSLFSKETLPSGGVRQFDMFQKITQNNLTCDFSQSVVDTQPAVVDFYIEGPPFTQPEMLPAGTSYGGITIVSNNTGIRLDTAAMSDLVPGDYVIRYYLRTDKSQSGAIPFTITAPPADHLDILTDSMTLDTKKDAVIDSLVIGYFDSTVQIYAVLRDVNGLFIRRAVLPTWTSRSTEVATVSQSPTDQSRCIVTKASEGVAWVVVSDPEGKLKPDSVKIITLILPKYPIIFSAIMLDTNADIIPDMLDITLSDTFKTDQSLDSITISYRGNTYVFPTALAIVNGTSVKVPFTPLTGTDGTPAGQAAISMTTDMGPQRSAKNFTDGVSPAIMAADVLENDGTGADTLFVTFSESIRRSSLVENQLLLIKAGTADTLLLNILQVLVQTNDSIYTLRVTSSGQQPKPGDRLRLAPGSKGGAIVDQNKNLPHDLNRSVILGLRLGPAAVIGAWYYDGNADGIIDSITLCFKRPVQQSAIKSITTKWNLLAGVMFDTVSLPAIKKMTDSSYSMPVRADTAPGSRITTHVAMEVLVVYNDFPDLPPLSAVVADSAAPVVTAARLVYTQTRDSARTDQLSVVFSETIKQPRSVHPFLVKSVISGVQYRFRLEWISSNNEINIFRVDTIEGGVLAYAKKGDSLWIDVLASISDNFGNTQLNPLNRRVPLDVVMPPAQPSQWEIKAVPNPFSPSIGSSTEIKAVSKKALLDPEQYALSIVIFDVIGNSVTSAVLAQKNNNEWSVVWDGRNHNKRIVSTGVYVGMVKIIHTGETFMKRVRIGVKR